MTNLGMLELHGVAHYGALQLPPLDLSAKPEHDGSPLAATVVACAQTALQR